MRLTGNCRVLDAREHQLPRLGRACGSEEAQIDDGIDRYRREKIRHEPRAQVGDADVAKVGDDHLLVAFRGIDDHGRTEHDGNVDGKAEVDKEVPPPITLEYASSPRKADAQRHKDDRVDDQHRDPPIPPPAGESQRRVRRAARQEAELIERRAATSAHTHQPTPPTRERDEVAVPLVNEMRWPSHSTVLGWVGRR